MEQDSFNAVFSRRLKHYLEAHNMTQAELAKRLGVGTTSVHNWCAGIKSPRMDKVDKMCEIFGCTRTDFMTEPSPTPSQPIQLTKNEQEHIRKYRAIDDSSRRMIDSALEQAYMDVLRKEGAISDSA